MRDNRATTMMDRTWDVGHERDCAVGADKSGYVIEEVVVVDMTVGGYVRVREGLRVDKRDYVVVTSDERVWVVEVNVGVVNRDMISPLVVVVVVGEVVADVDIRMGGKAIASASLDDAHRNHQVSS